MAQQPPAPHTVTDAMALCGLDNLAFFNGATNCQRFATDIFANDFNSCLDMTMTELEDDLKTYAQLTVNQGQIRARVQQKKNIKVFVQWAKDKIRFGEDPSAEAFPVAQAATLLTRYKTHANYVKRAEAIKDTAKPKHFNEKTKWDEWDPVFINFLRAIPGRNGIPLSYVVRKTEAATIIAGVDMIEDYINRVPLVGDAYNIDNAEVHTYIISFITGNTTAEAKILSHTTAKDGRSEFMALRDHYEGVGVNKCEILIADETINTLFYSGEKKPHMWWEEFEKRLTKAFAIYDKNEGRQVYSDEMKLRLLCGKVQADFLNATRTSIQIDLTRVPMTMTYDLALTNFRNEVNRKFPPDMSQNTSRSRRQVNELGTSRDQGGRGRGRGRGRGGRGGGRLHNNSGRGRGRGEGRGNVNGGKRCRAGARLLTVSTEQLWKSIQLIILVSRNGLIYLHMNKIVLRMSVRIIKDSVTCPKPVLAITPDTREDIHNVVHQHMYSCRRHHHLVDHYNNLAMSLLHMANIMDRSNSNLKMTIKANSARVHP